MNNILTVDVEDWYHGNYRSLPADLVRSPELVSRNTLDLLELLARHGARATFFVLGEVAERYPELVRAIAAGGHEIASHGYRHDLVYEGGPDVFRAEVRRSKTILEDAGGRPVFGYRAPSWSLTAKTPWAWEILEEEGYRYSASVFPVANYLYGIAGAPRVPYQPDPRLSLTEFPASCGRMFGRRVPFAGGFYLRLLPAAALRFFEKQLNRAGLPVVYYLHPREIDARQPRLPLGSRLESFIHHYGLSKSRAKFAAILARNTLVSFREFYSLSNASADRGSRAGDRAQG